MNEVYEFLKACHVYYIATTEGWEWEKPISHEEYLAAKAGDLA